MADGIGSSSSVDLEATKLAIITRLSTLITGLPTYEVDGTRFEWNEFIEALRRTLNDLDSLDTSVPYEFSSVYLDPSEG